MSYSSSYGSGIGGGYKLGLVVAVVLAVYILYTQWYAPQRASAAGYTQPAAAPAQSEGYGDVYFNPALNGDIYTRPTFTSNLDPNNPNLRFDPNASGGFIRGDSPATGMLAATNTVDTRAGLGDLPAFSEGFKVTLPTVGLQGGSNNYTVQNGVASGGMTDAAAGVTYSDFGQWSAARQNGDDSGSFVARLSNNTQLGDPMALPVVAPEGGEYEQQQNNFQSLLDEVDGSFAAKRQSETAKYQASLTKKYQADSQTYTDTKDMLPTPDMRQSNMRDPSDPANFMYDRTIFAKQKPRYGTAADKFRGDLNITPLKTGWFDVRATPTTDLARGYFGSFTDIQQTSDLQDAVYTRNAVGSSNDSFTSSINDRVNQVTTAIAQEAAQPKMAFGVAPPLSFGSSQQAMTVGNPFYNSMSQVVNRSFAA